MRREVNGKRTRKGREEKKRAGKEREGIREFPPDPGAWVGRRRRGSAVALFAFDFQGAQHCAVLINGFQPHIKTPQPANVLQYFASLLVEWTALELRVA